MRFASLFGVLASLSSLSLAIASDSPASDVELIATAAFPDTNVFNHVVNGEKNSLTVTVESKSDRNVTLVSIAGALLHPDTNALLKNLTALKYNIPLPKDLKLQFPFTFYSEFKTGDHRLNVWVESSTEDGSFKVEAYDSVITIVEPDFSIFDLKLLSTYAMVLAIFAGLGFVAYRSFLPQPKKTRAKKASTAAVSSPIGPVTATGAGGYQEEWIPEHHLRKTKGGKKTGAVSGPSGDELSGGEVSPSEGRRRKVKK